MDAFTEIKVIQSIRNAAATIERIETELRHLRCELRELDMVAGNRVPIQQSGDRREQPVQGSEYQAFQSAQKASKIVPAKAHPHWNPESTGDWGSVGASRDLGSWVTLGELTYQVPRKVHDAGSNEPSHAGGVQLEAETGHCGCDSTKDF